MNDIDRPKQWIILGKKQLRKSLFNQIENIPHFLKPKGGLWISPYTPQRRYKSDWERWCTEESFGDYNCGVLLTLPNNMRVYIIDSQKDLMEFILEVGVNKDIEEWFTIWKIPDYEKAAEKYDLIYLTEKGERETRLPWKNRKYSLYGWDCGSGILLNYRIKSQRPIKF
jgi:hypothetical protein